MAVEALRGIGGNCTLPVIFWVVRLMMLTDSPPELAT